jgi:cold shock CspA family protein
LRGEVLSFNEGTGEGFILAETGERYSFTAADVRSSRPPERDQRVEFAADEGRQARNIVEVHPEILRSFEGRGHFDLGRVIQRTFSSIRQNAAVFFGASIVLVGIPSTISALGQGSITPDDPFSGFGFVMLGTVFYFVGLYLLQGMVVKAAVNGFNGKKTAFGDAFNVGVRMFLPLLGLSIIATLGTMLGYVLLIVPGIILSVLWSVAAPAVVVENRGVLASLQRSRDLTRGYRWSVFGLIVIYVVLSWVIGLALGGLSLATGGTLTGGTPNLAVTLISGPLVNIVAGVLASAGVASLYYELRIAKEGVGADELASVFD